MKIHQIPCVMETVMFEATSQAFFKACIRYFYQILDEMIAFQKL